MKNQGAILLVAVLALAAGYFARRLLAPPAAKPIAFSSAPATATVARKTEATTTPAESAVDTAIVARNSDAARSLHPHDTTATLVRDIEQALQDVDHPFREETLATLLTALLKHDAAAAAYLAQTWEPGSIREELLRRVVETWTELSPAAAVAWIETLSDNHDRLTTASYACLTIAKTDPARAVQIAALFELGDYRSTLDEVMQLWAAADLRPALDWTRARPAGSERDRLLARIAVRQAQSEPADAAQLVVNEIGDPAVRDEAVLSVLHRWAVSDFAAAAMWVQRFPEGPLRERALGELAAVRNAQAMGATP